MRVRKIVIAVSGAVMLVSAVVIYVAIHPFPPSLDKRPHEALGWGMAQQALKFLQPGAEITVITRDTTVFENPAMDVQVASFKNALRQTGAKIGTIHALQVDPLRPLEVPPGDFQELIRNTPKGSVIVSFMGPPMLSPAQRAELKEIRPTVIALCPANSQERIDLQWLFAQGLLHSAVINRPQNGQSATRPRDLRSWFEKYYIAIVPTEGPKGGQNASR